MTRHQISVDEDGLIPKLRPLEDLLRDVRDDDLIPCLTKVVQGQLDSFKTTVKNRLVLGPDGLERLETIFDLLLKAQKIEKDVDFTKMSVDELESIRDHVVGLLKERGK